MSRPPVEVPQTMAAWRAGPLGGKSRHGRGLRHSGQAPAYRSLPRFRVKSWRREFDLCPRSVVLTRRIMPETDGEAGTSGPGLLGSHAERLSELAVESLPSGVLVVAPDGTIVVVNRRARTPVWLRPSGADRALRRRAPARRARRGSRYAPAQLHGQSRGALDGRRARAVRPA